MPIWPAPAAAATTATLRKPTPPPAGRMWLGAFSDLASVGTTGTLANQIASLAAREGQLQRTFDIGHTFLQMFNLPTTTAMQSHAAAGRLPLITIDGYSYADVLSGAQDATIAAAAAGLKAFGAPCLVRFAWEMNLGTTHAWTGPSNGDRPDQYVQMWHRVWRIFQEQGAHNVGWVWCPNAESVPGGTATSHANSWRRYYPGDGYVDFVAVDGYNWGDDTTNPGWLTAEERFGPFIADWRANFGGRGGASKPLLICEVGCHPTPGGKPHWLTDAIAYFASHGADGVILFDGVGSGNWSLDTSAASLTAAVHAAGYPQLGGRRIGGAGYMDAVLTDNPFTYWRLGEDAGGFTDLGTAGAAGSVDAVNHRVNRFAPLPRPGLGWGVSAGGVSGPGQINVGTLGNFGSSMMAGFTVEFLAQFGSATAGSTAAGAVLGTMNAGSTTYLWVMANQTHTQAAASGSVGFSMRTEGGAVRGATLSGLMDGLFHHVAWVCDPAATSDVFYVDGVPVTPTSQTAGVTAGTTADFAFPMALLARNNRYVAPGNGQIDAFLRGSAGHVALFKSKLSAARIAAHYAAIAA